MEVRQKKKWVYQEIKQKDGHIRNMNPKYEQNRNGAGWINRTESQVTV